LQKFIRAVFYSAIALAIPVITYDASRMFSDFVVYHRTTNIFLDGGGPLYGPDSGLGWPQYFRYPPLFLFLFSPFALLPLNWAAATWAVLKFLVLFALVRAMARTLDFPATGYWWLIPLLASASFLIQEFRNGNVQFLVFALTAFSLLYVETRPTLAAVLLSFAIIIKVWPFFFVPYLFMRRQFRVVTTALVMVVFFALLPAVHFGWNGNLDLLHQWSGQEWQTGSLSSAIWYPSQSLGGVLQTYFGETDRTRWPDPNYPDLQLLLLDPALLRFIWIALVGLGYTALLFVAWTNTGRFWLADSLAFASLPLLQPFAHRIIFLVILWPMTVAAVLLSRKILSRRSTVLIYLSFALFTLGPLIPGSQAHRFMEIAGYDFAATLTLAVGLFLAWFDLSTLSNETIKPC
jgi:hypothetical protein